MATEKQIDLILRLVEEREVPSDIDIDSVMEMDTAEASKTIGRLLRSEPLAGSQTAKDRETIASVKDGVYTLTEKQAGTVLNYKGEPYFGSEKVTVKVKWSTKGSGFWMERVNPNHPIKDSTVRRSVMLLLAKKTPKS